MKGKKQTQSQIDTVESATSISSITDSSQTTEYIRSLFDESKKSSDYDAVCRFS